MSLRIGILTVSDRSSRGERSDTSGPALERIVLENGWEVSQMEIVPDDFQTIKKVLINWVDNDGLDVILTTGGTGFSPRDITPEATQAVIERNVPGLAEAMRTASLCVTPHAMLSRAIAGQS
jgi:molybdopterin adenylyltransferase